MSEMKIGGNTKQYAANGSTPLDGTSQVFSLYAAEQIKERNALPPSVLCALSPGASLTYSVQVTGDNTGGSYNPANGNWFAFDGMTNLTASQNGTIGGRLTGLRVVVSNYVSGTLTVQVVI